MPKENDLEGVQDQGGKHGGQKGMPKSEPRPSHGKDQGIVRDERGQEQPRDKSGAQQVGRQDRAETRRVKKPSVISAIFNVRGGRCCRRLSLCGIG
jgi:hypothetical protein